MSNRALVAGDPRTVIAIALPIADRQIAILDAEIKRLRSEDAQRQLTHEIANARRLAAIKATGTAPRRGALETIMTGLVVIGMCIHRGLDVIVNG